MVIEERERTQAVPKVRVAVLGQTKEAGAANPFARAVEIMKESGCWQDEEEV